MATKLTKHQASVSRVGRTEGYEVQKHSHLAYEIDTGIQKHPKEINPTNCVVVKAGSDAEGQTVMLLLVRPNQDVMEHWNTGKYGYMSVSGIEVEGSEQIPEAFANIRDTYTFTAKRIILVDNVEAISGFTLNSRIQQTSSAPKALDEPD